MLHSGSSASAPGRARRRGSTTLTAFLDAEFADLLGSIEAECESLPKQLRIRVKRWVDKLGVPATSLDRLRNRNAYAMLLADHVRRGVLRYPYHAAPADAPLPTLPSELRSQVRDAKSRLSKKLSTSEQSSALAELQSAPGSIGRSSLWKHYIEWRNGAVGRAAEVPEPKDLHEPPRDASAPQRVFSTGPRRVGALPCRPRIISTPQAALRGWDTAASQQPPEGGESLLPRTPSRVPAPHAASQAPSSTNAARARDNRHTTASKALHSSGEADASLVSSAPHFRYGNGQDTVLTAPGAWRGAAATTLEMAALLREQADTIVSLREQLRREGISHRRQLQDERRRYASELRRLAAEHGHNIRRAAGASISRTLLGKEASAVLFDGVAGPASSARDRVSAATGAPPSPAREPLDGSGGSLEDYLRYIDSFHRRASDLARLTAYEIGGARIAARTASPSVAAGNQVSEAHDGADMGEGTAIVEKPSLPEDLCVRVPWRAGANTFVAGTRIAGTSMAYT